MFVVHNEVEKACQLAYRTVAIVGSKIVRRFDFKNHLSAMASTSISYQIFILTLNAEENLR